MALKSISMDGYKKILDQKSLPDGPGVYFFMGDDDSVGADGRKEKTILYIGKATSLRDRVRSYFSQDILSTRGPKIVRMLELATDIEWEATDSVLEALLLESRLIKKHQPPYNTDEKDDKSFYHVVITKEDFPRVLLVRGRGMKEYLVGKNMKVKYSFGPFPQGGALKEALKIVRKIFPFRDMCKPFECHAELVSASRENKGILKQVQDDRQGKPCFDAQIGLCPGVCDGATDAKEYAKTVRNIKLFFEGKKSTVVRNLKKEMKECSDRLDFEKAQALKKTLFALEHIRDVSLLKRDGALYEKDSSAVFRVEAYDVAHLSGKDVVGVMTVIEDGAPNKGEYRKFKLKTDANDDVANLSEILARRLKHDEWRLPDLIVADGPEPQMNAVKRALSEAGLSIPVVGVVKDAAHKPKEILGDTETVSKHRDAILLANGEAHRFAITFHRLRRGRNFLTNSKKKSIV